MEKISSRRFSWSQRTEKKKVQIGIMNVRRRRLG
jgi:hypothetical protein